MPWFAALKAVGGKAMAGGAAKGGAAAGGGASGGGGMMSKLGGMMGKGGGGGEGGGKSGGGIMDKVKGISGKSTTRNLSLATGLIQSIQANKLKKRAESAFPDLVDPSQAGFLAELGQKRKSLDTGSAFATGMQNIDASQAGTNEAITRASGGDTGATMQALLQGQRVAGDSKNAVLAQGQQQQLAYTQAYQGMLDQIAGRKLQLQMQRSQQAQAEWAAKQKSASSNLMAGMAGFGKVNSAPNLAGAQTPATQSGSVPMETPMNSNGVNWQSAIPTAATPTPASAGLSNATTVMGGKAAAAPMVSGNNLLGNGLSELSLKK